jgi:hypothetical protein
MSANPQVLPPESPVVAAGTLLQVIERAAANPAVDIDKMERLMAMHERMVARAAEEAWNDAMHASQSEMRPIAADANNPQTKSKYAKFSTLDASLRPIYTKHGFSVSYDTGESHLQDHVRIYAYVSKGAHTRRYQIDMPNDGKGAKGGDVMTKTHATGAANSYGRRYLLGDIFNVVIGEDLDGNAAPGMPETEIAGWITKIEATTSKEKAKDVWREGVKAAGEYKDTYASKRLKEALIKHGEFIDKADK